MQHGQHLQNKILSVMRSRYNLFATTDPNKQRRRAAKWVDEPGLYSMRVLTNCRQHRHTSCVGYGGSISSSIIIRGPANNLPMRNRKDGEVYTLLIIAVLEI
jgi:hypothetical protein